MSGKKVYILLTFDFNVLIDLIIEIGITHCVFMCFNNVFIEIFEDHFLMMPIIAFYQKRYTLNNYTRRSTFYERFHYTT